MPAPKPAPDGPAVQRVPFVDLTGQHQPIRGEIDAAVAAVIDSGRFILGEAVERFEAAFAAYLGVAHAIGVGNGLDALQLTLRGLGIGAGDEVIVPANTFIATALAVSATGARPVFVDCDASSAGLTAVGVTQAISPHTRAIIPVHLYGQAPADLQQVLEVAQQHDIPVIEDAAQAHGARVGERLCGTFGRAACFSFYPTKNLGACGDAGMIVTNDADLIRRIGIIRDYGQAARGHHVVQGGNSRLDALQAAILEVKLRYLERWNQERRQHAAAYSAALAIDGLTVPSVAPNNLHVFHLYIVRSVQRDALQSHLRGRGIETAIHYPVPIPLQPAYADSSRHKRFPVAEQLSREILSLPLFPGLRSEQRTRVIEAVLGFPAHLGARSR